MSMFFEVFSKIQKLSQRPRSMETQETNNEEAIYEFTTNGFVENPIGSIVIATVAGMGLMFVTIMIGMPIIISMAALFAGILLVYGYKSGKVTYRLYSDGLGLTTRRFIPYWLKKKEGYKKLKWEEVKSYTHDFDKTRTGEEYEYIKLYLSKSPGQIWVTNQRNKGGFEIFRDNFLQLVALDQQVGDSPETKVPKSNRIGKQETLEIKESSEKVYLVKRKSFYKTRAAKVLTILFVVISIFLVLLNLNFGLSWQNLFRLEVIIVPGIVYMIYRVYVKDD